MRELINSHNQQSSLLTVILTTVKICIRLTFCGHMVFRVWVCILQRYAWFRAARYYRRNVIYPAIRVLLFLSFNFPLSKKTFKIGFFQNKTSSPEYVVKNKTLCLSFPRAQKNKNGWKYAFTNVVQFNTCKNSILKGINIDLLFSLKCLFTTYF